MGGRANAHNWWIEILANYGIFIFAGYLIFFFSLLINLWRTWATLQDRTEKMLCEALLLGCITFIFAAISSSSIIALRPQWIFFGFALAFLNYCRLQAYSNVAQENIKKLKQIKDRI
jgi:teichuronic acid biosynthesis protein TuaE